jgi:hypothetical protein
VQEERERQDEERHGAILRRYRLSAC